MIDKLKNNVVQEKKILEDLNKVVEGLEKNPNEKLKASYRSLVNQLRILNNAVPSLLEGIGKPEEKKEKVVTISYTSPENNEKKMITINKGDKSGFVRELQISESGLSSLKRIKKKQEAQVSKPSEFAKISSKIFSKYSERLGPKFDDLSKDLKMANIRFLTSTYISIALFVSLGAFIASLIIFTPLVIFGMINFLWLTAPFFILGLCLFGFYVYPAVEKGSVQKKILDELPFATIHMAAIAGSNIEPTKIFKIIASSAEYPTVGFEIRKVINQTDLYGYDLVTALKNCAKQTANQKLSEMFNGLATNISSGGNLKNYLEKKAENYLADYRLERERYNDLAGTFMDIYISILITAPLILMMMLVVMNVSGLNIGLSLDTLLILSIAGIIIVNIIFIVVLEIKQPKT
jgi:pilus assembly protein TadC